ncbi:MAG: hypothetical protein UW76_C0044G0003 [Parcubacteria group bacterium GW2011_GWF2_44_8b]|nr:MAG: hypothetical protein UW76_C0044G0003 [Parcubacteria group bacterium GW2011_GWF2_44_8b]
MYNDFMMQYGFGYGGMMGGAGVLVGIVWLFLMIDLVLVGIWLWKQINK